MVNINGLSDDLLVNILSFLPTKVAVSTSVLSKRWERLWMWSPKLDFDDSSYSKPESKRLRCFLDRNLPLHKAVVIESLRLKFSEFRFKPKDVKRWIVIAVSCYVRELEISYYSFSKTRNILPSSLYNCESLVILKLKGNILLEVPKMAHLPSLKTLQLQDVVYTNEESLQRLLSICPILEELVVYISNNMRRFSIIVPSLESLSIYISIDDFELDEFVINTPSLKYLKLVDKASLNRSCLVEDMPKLREAYVDVDTICISNIKSLIRSITSVKSLTLSAKSYGLKDVSDDDGFVFNQLEHLKLCVCQKIDILFGFLNYCPNLLELDFSLVHGLRFDSRGWYEPIMVPECILSNLQILNWSEYFGTEDERDLAVYILKNATCLKKARFSSHDFWVPRHKMIQELEFSSRASTMCQLAFD